MSVKLFSFVFVLFLLQRLHFLHFNSIILKTNKPNKNRNIKKERKLINGQRRLKVLIQLFQFFLNINIKPKQRPFQFYYISFFLV